MLMIHFAEITLIIWVCSLGCFTLNQARPQQVPPPPVEICISCRHYHTGEFISLNVVYAVWIKPVVPAWCRDIKYIYRTNVGKIAFTEIIETIVNRCLRQQEQDITSRRLLLWKHSWTFIICEILKRLKRSAAAVQQVLQQHLECFYKLMLDYQTPEIQTWQQLAGSVV